MSHLSKRVYIANLFGTLFYLSCLLQWMWAALPYMPWIVRIAELLQAPVAAPAEPANVPVITSSPPSMTLVIITGIITVAIIVATIYVLIKIPTAVAKSGQKITQNASARIVPIVTHHTKLTPKKRRRLTARIIIYLKLIVCTTPIILSACAFTINTSLDYAIIMFVAAVLGIGSFTLLALQAFFAKWLKLKPEDIW
ncbi:hypothetical protein D3C85_204650 [compost metagenome]